jgi:hypothetical protein
VHLLIWLWQKLGIPTIITAAGGVIMWALQFRTHKLQIEKLRTELDKLKLEVEKLAEEQTQRDLVRRRQLLADRILDLARTVRNTDRRFASDDAVTLTVEETVAKLGAPIDEIREAYKILDGQGQARFDSRFREWIFDK